MRFSMQWLVVGLVLGILLGGCSSTPQHVVQRLDPLTGVTVRSATSPLVLYNDNSGYAAHARDYVYLGPVEVNRQGRYSYFLWLGIWSTMRDDLRQSPQRDGFESIVIYVDGEPFSLELEGWTPNTIGVSEAVYTKPVAGAAEAYYRVTADQIRRLATARDIELRTGSVRSISYRLWDEQSQPNASLTAFARSTSD